MKLEVLQQICEKCGSKLTERIEDDILSYDLDGYVIDLTDEPVLVRGLVEHPHPTNKKWQISEVIYDPGSYWEPPSSDLRGISKVDSLDFAVQKVLELIAIRNIEGHFVNAWEDEQVKQYNEDDF
jgi:hypothetical protein